MLYSVTLHTNPFQVPMYGLRWFDIGCVAKLSHLKRVVFRVVTFLVCSVCTSRWLVGDLVVMRLYGTPAARGWVFRCLFGVGIFYRDGDGMELGQ